MANKNIIRVTFSHIDMNISERANYIIDNQKKIAEYFNLFDWYLPDKSKVDFRKPESTVENLLNRIKKRITKHTTLKYIADDFNDSVATRDGFYSSTKFDKECLIEYILGGELDDINRVSQLLVKKYETLDNLSSFSKLRDFLMKLIEVFDPHSIEVSDYRFYSEFMDLESDEYWFGDITYFAKGVKIPKLPPDIDVDTLANGGKFVSVFNGMFDYNNINHLEKAKSLVELFRTNNIKLE